MNMPVPQPWVRICTVDDIPRLGSRVVERSVGNIAVFRSATDTVTTQRMPRTTRRSRRSSIG